MFIAHDIAGWLGVPVAIVIVVLIVLRKQGMALRARRKQARADNAGRSTSTDRTEQ